MNCTGDARIIGPDKHLGQQTDLVVGSALFGQFLGQGNDIVMDVTVVLTGGDDAVGLSDSPVFIKLIPVVEDTSGNLHCSGSATCPMCYPLAGFLPVAAQQLINEEDGVLDHMGALHQLSNIVHKGVVTDRLQA